jgi:hypothetical protein
MNVSGFSLPLLKTDRHHTSEKLLSMAKNDKQTETENSSYLKSECGSLCDIRNASVQKHPCRFAKSRDLR